MLLHVLISSNSSTLLASDSELSERFRMEAPKKWEEYETFTKSLNGSQAIHIEADGEKGNGTLLTYKSNPSCGLVHAKFPGGQKPEAVMAFNSQYSFALQQRGASWILSQLHVDSAVYPEIGFEIRTTADGTAILISPHYIRLNKLITQPNFKVVSATATKAGDKDLVEVVFDNTHAFVQGAFFPIQKGRLTLDPEQSWCVHSAELLAVYGNGEIRIAIGTKYSDGVRGFPVPQRYEEIRSAIVSLEGRILRKGERHLREFHYSVPDEYPPTAEFTLTAFGLPEPHGVDWRRPTPWYVWLMGAGFAGIIIAWLFTRLKRRFSTP
jgi:hypothetical protein